MYHAVPERPQNQCEEEQLHDGDEDEPVEKQEKAHEDLEHLWVEMLLPYSCFIFVNCVTLHLGAQSHLSIVLG